MQYTLYQDDNFVMEGTVEEIAAYATKNSENAKDAVVNEEDCKHIAVSFMTLGNARFAVCNECGECL